MTDSTAVPGGLSFIHIPKNAGTSVVRAIVDNRLPILYSDHSYPARLTDEEIVVLRSPLDRFISAFYYGRKYWPNQVNAQFESADELASSAADPGHAKHSTAWMELGNLPEHFLLRNGEPKPQHTVASRITRYCWVYEPQSSWMINQPRHVLRYRHLADDFGALLETSGLPRTVELPRANRSESVREDFSAAALAFLERMYQVDFDLIRSRGLDV